MIISKEHFAPATTPKKDISFPAILRPFKCDHLVRLGQDYDGGYIVNSRDVEKSDILISMGIKDDWSFEMDFSKINDCEMVCLDKESQVSSDDVFYTGHRQMIYKNIGLEPSVDVIPFDHIINLFCHNFFDIQTIFMFF